MAAPPAGLTLNWQADGSLLAAWQESTDTTVAGYVLSVSADGGATWNRQPLVSGRTVTSAVIAGYPQANPPLVRIACVDAGEASAPVKAPGGGVTRIELALTADKTGVIVQAAPVGAARVGFAVMPSGWEPSKPAERYEYRPYPLEQPFVPPSGFPIVDAVAESGTGAALGGWNGRLTTTPVVPPPPPPPPPPEPVTAGVLFGVVGGGWGSAEDDLKGVVNVLRGENMPSSEIAHYATLGIPVIDLYGHYTSGVQAINPATYANEALARVKANPSTIALEALNEPQNPYFWGSGAESQSNIEAYARIINATVATFKAAGVKAKVLWSCDGGFRGVSTWGAKVWPLLSADAKALARPTVHPYGGTGERARSALGNRARVTETRALTGLKAWVTEIGWPTAVGQPSTGDSLQWSEAEQAANFKTFAEWVSKEGLAECVAFFNYRDYGTNDWYGIESHEGRRKAAYYTLKSLAFPTVAEMAEAYARGEIEQAELEHRVDLAARRQDDLVAHLTA